MLRFQAEKILASYPKFQSKYFYDILEMFSQWQQQFKSIFLLIVKVIIFFRDNILGV